MKYFFAFWPHIPKYMAFPSFGVAHISAMIAIATAIGMLIRSMKDLTQEHNERILRAAALMLPAIEITRVMWLIYTGEHWLIKLLPLHLCSMQVFFVPMAVFTNIKGFKELVYCTCIIGGIAGIVFPVGVSNTYPFLHYQTLETLLFHAILIFVPLALIVRCGFRPKIKYFPQALALFALTAVLAAAVDFGYGQNYMFIAEPPVGTPFEYIFDNFGRPVYWMSFLIFGCLLSLVMMIPFIKKDGSDTAK